jgi:hypothetical protein
MTQTKSFNVFNEDENVPSHAEELRVRLGSASTCKELGAGQRSKVYQRFTTSHISPTLKSYLGPRSDKRYSLDNTLKP